MLSKKDKLKAVQAALGTKPDGIIGEHTADVLYRQFADPQLPYSGKFFGCNVIIGNPNYTTPRDVRGEYGCWAFSHSMSGSFSANNKPVSILIHAGQVFRRESCHYPTWDGRFPESVLWYKPSGEYGISLVELADELPGGPGSMAWAIGGGQIMRYGQKVFNGVAEGFAEGSDDPGFDEQDSNQWTGRFSDVARYTQHAAIGFDKYGNVLGVIYSRRCTLKTFQEKLESIGMIDGIFVDGGSVVAMCSDKLNYRASQPQAYIIQF